VGSNPTLAFSIL